MLGLRFGSGSGSGLGYKRVAHSGHKNMFLIHHAEQNQFKVTLTNHSCSRVRVKVRVRVRVRVRVSVSVSVRVGFTIRGRVRVRVKCRSRGRTPGVCRIPGVWCRLLQGCKFTSRPRVHCLVCGRVIVVASLLFALAHRFVAVPVVACIAGTAMQQLCSSPAAAVYQPCSWHA